MLDGKEIEALLDKIPGINNLQYEPRVNQFYKSLNAHGRAQEKMLYNIQTNIGHTTRLTALVIQFTLDNLNPNAKKEDISALQLVLIALKQLLVSTNNSISYDRKINTIMNVEPKNFDVTVTLDVQKTLFSNEDMNSSNKVIKSCTQVLPSHFQVSNRRDASKFSHNRYRRNSNFNAPKNCLSRRYQ